MQQQGEALTGCYLLLQCDTAHDLIVIHQGQLVQLLRAQFAVCTLLLPAVRRNTCTSEVRINSKGSKQTAQTLVLLLCSCNMHMLMYCYSLPDVPSSQHDLFLLSYTNMYSGGQNC